MDYQYDAFFSYKRDPQSDIWHEAVKDKLAFWLRMELNQPDVRIFFDKEEIRTGVRWRQKISDALRHSKCLVCVWSPCYFQSKWCISEWWTFREREQIYQCDLVLPASYHDGDFFPCEAQDKQWADFSHYTSTVPSFWNSTLADEFERAYLKVFARDLAALIRGAPAYRDDFPIVEVMDNQIKGEDIIGRISET